MVRRSIILAWLFMSAAAMPLAAEKTVFYDQVTGCEIWRITNDPEVFYTHHYVEIPSIDATGRWVGFHETPEGRAKDYHVYVADLVTGRVKHLGKGVCPVWHPTKPIMFYGLKGQQVKVEPTVMRAEAPEWKPHVAVEGGSPGGIRGTSPDGRYGVFIKDNAIWRVRLKPGSRPKLVWRAPPGIRFAGHMRYNPSKPWLFILAKVKGVDRWNGPSFVIRDDGSDVRQFDILGETIGHLCWAGDGSGMLRANMLSPAFKPFPLRADTPWRTLSRSACRLSSPFFMPNHIGACGRDGRLVVTDNGNQTLHITDSIAQHSYLLCVASGFSLVYSKDGDPHAVGSPDGTKVQFDSCYDLCDHGVALLTHNIGAETRTLKVTSTEGFPHSGVLLIGGYRLEFVRYKRKDKTHFLDCERGLTLPIYKSYSAPRSMPARPQRKGWVVTEYLGRFLTPGVRRGPQIFVAVVRDPQPPKALTARVADQGTQLTWQPPALHNEIAGYRVERSKESGRGFATIAQRVTGAAFTDSSAKGAGPYFYRVVSIERCGLESVPSAEAMVTRSKRPPAGIPRRLFIEAETCPFVGEGGAESSPGCYGRQYAACHSLRIEVPFTLAADSKCAVWMRLRTGAKGCWFEVWACRAGFPRTRVDLSSPNRFTWRRLETAAGKPLLVKATRGQNCITIWRGGPFDLDRLCVTDDLKFVPPDEPNAKLPAPRAHATALSPYEVKLEWAPAPAGSVTLYEVRDAKTDALIGRAQRNAFVLKGMRPNSERNVRVVPFSRWGTPGEPSAKVVCRPRRIRVVRAEAEAESCKLRAPMARGKDPAASGGGFVHVPHRKSGEGALTFDFTTPVAGDFLIAGRTFGCWRAPKALIVRLGRSVIHGHTLPGRWRTPMAQALKLSVDGGQALYMSATAQEWQWWPADTKPTPAKPSWRTIRLAPGKHTLTITTDQDRVLLDKLMVTNDTAWRPASEVTLVRRFVDVRPIATPGAETLLLPGKPGKFSIIVSNRRMHPVTCSVKMDRAPSGLSVTPDETAVKLPGRGQRVVTFDVKPAGPKVRGGHVRLLIETAGQKQRCEIPVRVLERPITLVQVEAEKAIKLPKSAKVVQSDEASGGRLVEYTDGDVVLEFDLPKEADYIVWVRRFAPHGGAGQFAGDGRKSFRMVGNWRDVFGRWAWLTSPRAPRHHWKAGKLRLTFSRRGYKFRWLDQVVVTDDPDFEPGW